VGCGVVWKSSGVSNDCEKSCRVVWGGVGGQAVVGGEWSGEWGNVHVCVSEICVCMCMYMCVSGTGIGTRGG
jgi:hypothetical protein